MTNLNFKSIILTLVTLLTFGVGQMWATTWTVAGSDAAIINGTSTWCANCDANDLTNVSGNYWALEITGKSPASSSYTFKICQDHAWTTAYPASNYGFNNIATGSGTTILYTFNSSTHAINAYGFKAWTVAGSEAALGSDWNTTDANNKMSKGSNVYTYTLTKKNMSLAASTTYEFKIVKDGAYTVSFPASNKTFTVATAGRYDITFSIDLSTQTVSVSTTPSTYSITLNKNGGSANGSATATYNNTSLSSISAPTRSNYHVEGYYTNAACTTKVATSAGALQSGVSGYTTGTKWTKASDATLYANWEGDTWGITWKDQGNVTYSGSNGASLPSTYRYGTGIASLPEGVKSGYRFDGWFSESTCSGDAVTSISSSATGAKTFYAKWTENPGGTVTLTAGTGGQVSKDNSSWGSSKAYTGVKTTDALNIYAQANTGYTFSSWTRTSGTGTIASTSSASTTYTPVANADAELTANFSQVMSSLSTSCHYDAGNPSYSAPTVSGSATTIGYVTTRTITAAAAGTGYTFAGWTITNGTRTDGGGATANPITVRSNGDGAAVTVVANYNEVLTSSYVLKGSFDTWGSGVAMSKKSGHSTEDWVYCTKEFTTSSVTLLKIFDGSSTWFGATASDNSLVKKTGSLKIDDWDLTSTSGGENINFGHYISGTYEFAYNTSTKKFYVTWPDVNQLQIYSADPTDATNTNYFDLSSPVSNVRSKSLTLNANTTYTFKIVYGSDYYGKTSGTLTRSNSTSSNTLTGLSTSGGDMTITTDIAGSYTFKFNQSTKTLSVDYPTAYQVSLDVGTVKGNKNTPIIYKTSVDNANKVSNGTWLAAGTKVIFWAANNQYAAKSGYDWWGFYDNASGNNPTKYTNADVGLHTVNSLASNMTVYAVFAETNYWITPYINGQGSISPNGANAHIATTTSFTANPGTGYKFDSWEERGGSAMTIASPSAATTNVTTTAAATLQANFSPRWSVIGTGAFGGWSAYDAHKFDNYAVVSTKNVGYNTITLAANTNYEIKVYDRQTSTTYGGSSNQDITYATSGSGNEYTIATTSSPKSVFIQSAAAGSYTLNWNLTDKKIAVVYPTSWYITTGQNDEDGGSFTAVDNSSNNVKGGKFVANNATVTFTASKNTGYNFGGWYSNEGCTTAYVDNDDDINLSGDDNKVLTLSSITADKEAYAKFTAKTYTITLSRSGTGYGSGGTANVTATYNATMPAIASMPTAANGYAFMGYYNGENGTGTQFTNASGVWVVSSVTDTIADSKWKLDAGATLYAYFKKAEITGITLSPGATVAPSTDVTPTTVTATPTVSPTPVGTTKICWKLLRDNGNPITPQPTFSPGVGNAVTFPAPKVSGSYKVACVLRTGSECGAGTVLDSVVSDLVVAGEHTVTIQYQDGDGRTLKDTIHITGKPLEWTTLGDITPPSITGYTFARWEAGDGITIKNGDSDPVTTTTTSSIQIKAIYDGTLTAVYTKKDIIYFNNTLGWDHVYVYFYSSNAYWNASNGTGAYYNKEISSTKAHWYHFWGEMTQIGDGDIYYFDYQEAAKTINPTYWSEINGYTNVVFTKDPQGYGYGDDLDKDGTGDGYEWFYKTKVVRRSDFNHGLPMFVPLAEQEADVYNESNYYNDGYWMNYPENSGYTLKIYNNAYATKETAAVREFTFPYSEDLKLPLKLDVEFNDAGNHEYWFMVYRNDGTYLGNTYTFNQDYNDEQIITGGNNKSKLVTSAPGNYKFTLTYYDDEGVNYYIDVDFPIATGDYRIVYSDNAIWSQGTHGASWNHPSDVIAKIDGEATEDKKDIVSFFISKGEGITPAMKFQYASAIDETTGDITWTNGLDADHTSSSDYTIDLSDFSSIITKAGVYNFYINQPTTGGIEIEKVEPYTGNFYIRTDCAGNTKWDSFKNIDHLMTYSEFAKDNSGFTHYYAHWVTTGQNVKFTIANDYSMCISDTLIGDYGTAIADIDGVGILESGNASIRFMWDQATNKISRAYISGSSVIADRFLVLEGDSRLFDENGASYSISGLSANQVNLIDDQNFVYERIIKVQPGAQAKLTAKYNGNVQYFQGGSGSTSADSIILLGGKASVEKYDMRIVYDFKTNRLIRAYQPSGTIDDSLAINADMMIVREHQDAGNQLVLTKDGTLSEVKTVYGVMRFNRWTLNNKDKSSHSALPVSEQKSSIWRGLYWISFPFDVNLSDVFGFGTYGTDWIIMYYDGAGRAEKGYWADSKSFWTYIWNRRGVTLKAGEGYVLALELPNMKDDNTSFWTNNIDQVELFFPSASTVNKIKQTNVDITVDAHECTIDRRTDKSSGDANKDRTIADSHWNVIGVPSYANYGTTLKDGSGATITWNSNPATQGLPFLYEWNANDNTYTPQSGTTYNFKSMHSYIVQYTGTLRWLLASATPSSIVARRTYSEAPQSVEFRLELQQDDEFIDQTFVKMSNDEEVSAAFAFGEDMTKEFNGSKSNIYTLIENYLPTAGNTLPISESITIVPVGIKIKADGDYTFAIPDGTDGVGITLVDEETGIRTNLSLLNYNVYLEAGTYNNRFYLEISPVRKTPTSLEGTQSNDIDAKVRKVLINDILYIVKDGMIFDAHGARVQ